jgi:hypothetical protein
MSENDWPDHHDGHDDHQFDHDHDLGATPEQPLPEPPDDAWHLHDDLPDPEHHHDTTWEEEHAHPPHPDEALTAEPVAHETPDDTPPALEPVEVFPPILDVGPLPEPVDGWPWIDTGSLGLAHAGIVDQAMLDRMPAQDPAELAEYAAEDLPPGADPWAHLASSEDPATAALAEYYRPGDTDA